MNLQATITTEGDSNALQRLFTPELEGFDKKRSTVTLKKEKNTLTFVVTAADSVALRSTLTGITKLLTVYEKTLTLGDANDSRNTRKD